MKLERIEDVSASLASRISPEAREWLDDSLQTVARDAGAIGALFPAVSRKIGRIPLHPASQTGDVHAWTVDDAGRVLLLAALREHVGEEVSDLYRYGDAGERRGVLRALPFLDIGDAGLPLVEDAIRTNDLHLIAAALGPYGVKHLSDDGFRQAILKCVFTGIPITDIEGLEDRVTPELARMLAGYVHERVAAGRDVPQEVWTVIDRFPPHDELEAIKSELDHPVEERREAARRALAASRAFEEM